MNIQEFAARLKLSVSTVSKAMNGREDVSAATRERVLAAASRVGRAGCARFIALGHRRIALVHSPEFLMFSRHQRVGYEAALRAAGIEFDPALCVEEAISEEGGVAAARRLLDLLIRPRPSCADTTWWRWASSAPSARPEERQARMWGSSVGMTIRSVDTFHRR